MSIQALADFYDLRWHTIKELEKKHLQKKFSRIQTAQIKAIVIDEIHVGKGMQNQQYLTIYSWISELFPNANIVFDHFHVI